MSVRSISSHSYDSRNEENNEQFKSGLAAGAVLTVGGIATGVILLYLLRDLNLHDDSNNYLTYKLYEAGDTNSRSVGYLALSAAIGAVSQSALYYSKTPKKEFSAERLRYAALQGAGAGFTTQTLSNILDSAMLPLSPFGTTIAKPVREVLLTTISHVAQLILSVENPSENSLTAAFLSKGAVWATAAGLDRLLPIAQTMNQFIRNEAIKGGAGGALATYISNLLYKNCYGETKKWNENLLIATAAGAAIGATGAALQGKLPHELKSKEELETEKQKWVLLKADYEEKRGAYYEAKESYESAVKSIEELKKSAIKPKKEAAISAYNDFVATGRGEAKWKELQGEVLKTEKVYDDKLGKFNLEDPLSIEFKRANKAYSEAPYKDLCNQTDTYLPLRAEFFHQDRALDNSYQMIAALPTTLEAVDPLKTKIERIERAEKSARTRNAREVIQKRKDDLLKRLAALEKSK